MVNGKRIRIAVLGAKRRCYLCSSAEHVKADCPKNQRAVKESTGDEREPGHKDATEVEGVQNEGDEEWNGYDTDMKSDVKDKEVSVAKEREAVEPHTDDERQEFNMGNDAEFPSYSPQKRFAATKRGLSTSPHEEVTKKIHLAEEKAREVENDMTNRGTYEKLESSPRTSLAVGSILDA